MTNHNTMHRRYIDELKARREQTLTRARERGAALQRYLVAINGGGLIATFSLAGVYVERSSQSLSVFIWPAIFFAAGITAAGITIARAIRLQHLAMDKLDELIDCLELVTCTAEEEKRARDAWKKHDESAKQNALKSHNIQLVGLILFAIGIFVGLASLSFL